MGLFSAIIFASFLTFRGGGEPSDNLEDLEKARRQVEHTGDNDSDENEQQSRGPEPNGHIEDDNESIHDSGSQDVDEDEPEEPPSPGRRVTFDGPSGEDSPPSEKGSSKRGYLARLKAIVFPPHGEDKALSNYRILPIISGLIIPFSILLEIPGIISSWYIRTDGNIIVETRRNSSLLEIGLAFSMFFAVVANVSLICRFLEKGPVLVTTLITIFSLTIHGNASPWNRL
jgi:potassium channel subfamily K